MRDATFIVFMSIGLLSSGCALIGVGETKPYSTLPDANTPAEDNEVDKLLKDTSRTDIVRSISFVGNRKYKDKTLRQRLDFQIGDYFDQILVEAGRRTIVEIYRKIGFASVQVTLDSERLSQGQVTYIIDEGPRVTIASVQFRGNNAVKTGTLKEAIKTKEQKWFYWPFYYTDEMVAEDIERLENLYYERGFLDYDITAKTEYTDDKSQAHVTFVIDEGPIYRVENIFLAGNERFDEETLRAGLQLEPGQVYIKRKAESDAERLAKLYREYGFIDAEVVQRPKFVPDVNMVKVEFEITEGSQFRIGRVDITGNESVQGKAVRRVLDEYGFTPGQLYNADMAPKQGGGKLEEYVQRKVVAEQVIIRPEGPPYQSSDDPNLLGQDVIVDIEEGKTGSLQPGIGISSDIGVIGSLVYDQRNFDVSDWPESFGEFITMNAFKGAGQRLRISLAPGTEVSVYSVDFSDPYWRDRPTTFALHGSKYRWFRRSHDEDRLRSRIGFEQRREGYWRPSLSFRAENVDVGNLDSDAPQEIRAVKGDNSLFGSRVGIGRNLTDDEYNPSAGYTFDVGYEQVTGDDTFGILGGTYVWYKTLYEDLAERKTVLATKLHSSTTLGDAPPFEKFYAGGTGFYGIRGFEYRGVSTRGLQTNVPNPQRKDPIGSDWIFLANSELSVPLIGKNLAALFFIDSGAIDSGTFRAAVGTGIEILLPQWFGPVPMRVEFAVPLRKDDDDETEVFSFSIGGPLF